jgi:hypothetical protein
MATAIAHLATLWVRTAQRLAERCAGLNDEEFIWEPVPDYWNIRPDNDRPAASPRGADNWIYWEYAYSAGSTGGLRDLGVAVDAFPAARRPADYRLPACAGSVRKIAV